MMKSTVGVASLAMMLSLSACGGGGSTAPATGTTALAGVVSLAGVVVDGYLDSATVCLDVNKNKLCDAVEPTATTANMGKYNFTNLTTAEAQAPILVKVIAGTTTDSDLNGATVSKAYTLLAPAGSTAAGASNVVSPLTTLVQIQKESNPVLTTAQAELQVKAKLGYGVDSGVSLFTDFIAASGVAADPYAADYGRVHNIARVAAEVLADHSAAVDAYSAASSVSNRIAAATTLVFNDLVGIAQSTDAYSVAGTVITTANIASAKQVATVVTAATAQTAVSNVQQVTTATTSPMAAFMQNDVLNWINGSAGVVGFPGSAYYGYGKIPLTQQPNGTYTGGEDAYTYAAGVPGVKLNPTDPYAFVPDTQPFAQMVLDANGTWTAVTIAKMTVTAQADGSGIETQGNLAGVPDTASNFQVKHQLTFIDLYGQTVQSKMGPGYDTAVDPYATFSTGAQKIVMTNTVVNDTYLLDYQRQPVSSGGFCSPGGMTWVDAYSNCAITAQLMDTYTGGLFLPANLSEIVVTSKDVSPLGVNWPQGVTNPYAAAWVAGGLSSDIYGRINARNAANLSVSPMQIGSNGQGVIGGGLVVLITAGANGGNNQAEFYDANYAVFPASFKYLNLTSPVVPVIVSGQTIWKIDIPVSLRGVVRGEPNAPMILAAQGGFVRSGQFMPAGMVRAANGELYFNNQGLSDILANFVNP